MRWKPMVVTKENEDRRKEKKRKTTKKGEHDTRIGLNQDTPNQLLVAPQLARLDLDME